MDGYACHRATPSPQFYSQPELSLTDAHACSIVCIEEEVRRHACSCMGRDIVDVISDDVSGCAVTLGQQAAARGNENPGRRL